MRLITVLRHSSESAPVKAPGLNSGADMAVLRDDSSLMFEGGLGLLRGLSGDGSRFRLRESGASEIGS